MEKEVTGNEEDFTKETKKSAGHVVVTAWTALPEEEKKEQEVEKLDREEETKDSVIRGVEMQQNWKQK